MNAPGFIETTSTQDRPDSTAGRFIDAPGLLDQLFDPSVRPSLRWLRQMCADRRIPFRKVGGKVLFIAEEVRQFLDSRKVGGR
jgi:hypothetical protein